MSVNQGRNVTGDTTPMAIVIPPFLALMQNVNIACSLATVALVPSRLCLLLYIYFNFILRNQYKTLATLPL